MKMPLSAPPSSTHFRATARRALVFPYIHKIRGLQAIENEQKNGYFNYTLYEVHYKSDSIHR